MTEFGCSDEHGGLGDVDVLAWRENKPIVFIVECKRLSPALTIGEVAGQLERFRGEEKDLLDKHVRRYQWLELNKRLLERVIGVSTPTLELRGLLVTNTIVPMQFRRDLPIAAEDIVPVTSLESRVATILATFAPT